MRTRSLILRTVAGVVLGAVLQFPAACGAQGAGAAHRESWHRLLVLTDIENEPDDAQSMVRLLLYANEIDIQGLVATTSIHLRSRIAPESIEAILRAYARVHPNLLKHDSNYPRPELLQSLVKKGRAEYGMNGVGPGKDSEGSDWIIQVLEQDDPRPLWVSVWGGSNTLAQALHKLRATKTPAVLDRLIAKLRVYTISDQDDSGAWMRKQFPNLFYVVSPGGYGAATWTGIHTVVPGIDNSTVSNQWLAENIQGGHGPLGAAYPDVAYGMEGDTPSWLGLVPNGLGNPEHPEWGGWGGRYELYTPELSAIDPQGFTGGVPVHAETRPIWTNAIDEYSPPVRGEFGRATRAGDRSFKDFRVTVWRWRDDFQNDFAARMDWTVKAPGEANHPPVPVLKHAETMTVRSGQAFQLNAAGSTDPDGDSLSYLWFQYREAGSYKGALAFPGAANTKHVNLIAPVVEKPETVHFIVRVTDKGRPPLSRYQRVIVTVTPGD